MFLFALVLPYGDVGLDWGQGLAVLLGVLMAVAMARISSMGRIKSP